MRMRRGVAVGCDLKVDWRRPDLGFARAITLGSPLYSTLPEFPLDAYRCYCADFESKCLGAGSYGGKWSNVSCERQFGSAGAFKDLEGNGAPRWKQRAFYDFVKDLSPLLINVKVVRVAIWDRIADGGASRPVHDILSRPTAKSAEALAAFIRERAA
jgi:hypothetical protein